MACCKEEPTKQKGGNYQDQQQRKLRRLLKSLLARITALLFLLEMVPTSGINASSVLKISLVYSKKQRMRRVSFSTILANMQLYQAQEGKYQMWVMARLIKHHLSVVVHPLLLQAKGQCIWEKISIFKLRYVAHYFFLQFVNVFSLIYMSRWVDGWMNDLEEWINGLVCPYILVMTMGCI